MSKKAVIIPGDGIGPEVVQSMIKVLKDCNFSPELIVCDMGSSHIKKLEGTCYISDQTIQTLKESDTCFKGPSTSSPKIDQPYSATNFLRQKFQLYSNIRPYKTYSRLSPHNSFEIICFREVTEGLIGGLEFKLSDDDSILIWKTTRKACHELISKAFSWAKNKNFKKIVGITKRNIFRISDGVFWEELEKISKKYPDIEIKEMYIDNIAQQLVRNPKQFDNSILISTNLFMDIISELCAGLIGSIGLSYGQNVGKYFSMFETAHGSAPSLAGRNIVNPSAAILGGAWMAEYLGEVKIKEAIFSSTEEVINEGKYVTYDLGGNASTIQMTDAILEKTKRILRK